MTDPIAPETAAFQDLPSDLSQAASRATVLLSPTSERVERLQVDGVVSSDHRGGAVSVTAAGGACGAARPPARATPRCFANHNNH